MPAMDDPALPVETRIMSLILFFLAATDTRKEARFLNDDVGLVILLASA